MRYRRLLCIAWILAWPVAASAADTESAHFHHVRLNVQDIEASRAFYQKVFGATPVDFNNQTPGLFTERSFILFNEVDQPPYSNLKTALWHIGWGGVDGPSEYQWWKQQGVEFHTPLQPLGDDHYMYLYGPDREVVEIYTGNKHHRFNHVHILASEPKETAEWLMETLALPAASHRPFTRGHLVLVDNVQIIIFPNSDRYRPAEQGDELRPTDDSTIAHIAFSFRDLASAYQRLKTTDVQFESAIETSAHHGLDSFFLRAPDGILVEMVETDPIPQGIWE